MTDRAYWDGLADSWDAWAAWTDRTFEPITEWLRGAAGWSAGARVLDVACGAGYPALASARHVLPGGTVVAIDRSPAMTAAADRRAAAAGLRHMRCLTMDAGDLGFRDASFDAAVNAYGLAVFADPLRAMREAHRVLKPGGRAAVVAWADPAASPFFSIVSNAPPEPSQPNPFALARAGRLESILGDAGFRDVRIETVTVTCAFDSVEEFVRARVPESTDDFERVRAAVEERARPYCERGRVLLPAASLCASARKAD